MDAVNAFNQEVSRPFTLLGVGTRREGASSMLLSGPVEAGEKAGQAAG